MEIVRQVFFGEGHSEKERRGFWEKLDQQIESGEDRRGLALQIHAQKRELLKQLGFEADYQKELRQEGKEWVFTNPDKAEDAREKLREVIDKQSKIFKRAPGVVSLKTALAALAALSEITVLGPDGLAYSQKLQQESHQQGKQLPVGIQPRQLEAILAVFSSHPLEFPSGQGKSKPVISTAVTAQALLTDRRVHLWVRDPQAVGRDHTSLKKLTEPLEITVGVVERGERLDDITNLTIAVQLINTLPLEPEAKDALKKHWLEEKEQCAYQLAQRKIKKFIHGTSRPPDIAIGTPKDFVFDRLEAAGEVNWEDDLVVNIDEGDLEPRRGTDHVIDTAFSSLEHYLPDWLGSVACETVCHQLQQEQKITVKNGRLGFWDSDGQETDAEFEERFWSLVSEFRETGRVPQKHQAALAGRVAEVFASLPKGLAFRVDPASLNLAGVIREYAGRIDPNQNKESEISRTDVAADFQFAWLAAGGLTEGSDYRTGEALILIDPHTGHPLPSHRFQGLIDVLLEAQTGRCSLKSRGGEIEAATGVYAFLREAYGLGKVSLVSATLADLASEVRWFCGKPLVVVDRWIGKSPEDPEVFWAQNFTEGFDRLIELLEEAGETGRPVELICDNDLELEWLAEQLRSQLSGQYQVSLVTSQTNLSDESKIFKEAGQVHQLTLANPRGSRMTDIVPTPEADQAGGLLVIIWGPLAERSVVKQARERTNRAGHPGDAAWIVYKEGQDGRVGLLNNRYVQPYVWLKEKVDGVKPGLYPLEDSPLEEIYKKRGEESRAQRLMGFARDNIRKRLWVSVVHGLSESLDTEKKQHFSFLKKKQPGRSLVEVASERLIGQLIKDRWGVQINDLASILTRDAYFFFGLGDPSTYAGLVQTLGNAKSHIETIIRRFLHEEDVVSVAKKEHEQIVKQVKLFQSLRLQSDHNPNSSLVSLSSEWVPLVGALKKQVFLYFPSLSDQYWQIDVVLGKDHQDELTFSVVKFITDGAVDKLDAVWSWVLPAPNGYRPELSRLIETVAPEGLDELRGAALKMMAAV